MSDSILCISGAGFPGWIWDGVRAELDSRGTASAVAPRPAVGDASLANHAAAAIAAMDALAGDRPVTLVAHSAGGVVASAVASRAPERIAGILGVSAIIPREGGSFVSAMPIPQRWILSLVMRLAGTRPPESAIRGTLAAGIDDAVVDRLVADFEPESQRYYRDRAGLGGWSGRAGYVVTTNDRELAPAQQRRFAERLAGATPGELRRTELATGHLPMLEDPSGLADAIHRFG